jgi:hypothetical protein
MATLDVFRTNIAAILGLTNTTAGDQTRIDYYVNEGVLEVLKNTQCHVSSATVAMSAGSGNYTLDTDVLQLRDLYCTQGGSTYILERRTVNDILNLRLPTSSSSGPARFYALAGSDLLMFHPTPAAGDSFTLYYVPYPTALSSSAHAPSNSAYGGVPDEIHNAIERYALWKCADMDDDASSQVGEKYRVEYYQTISEARRHLRSKGGYKLGRVRVNPRRSPRTPSDPSVSVAW